MTVKRVSFPSLSWLCMVVAVALLAELSFGASTVSGDERGRNSAPGQSSESSLSPSGADDENPPPPDPGLVPA